MSDTRIEGPVELDQESGQKLLKEVKGTDIAEGRRLVLDLANTQSMDSLGGACLIAIADYTRARKAEMLIEGQQGKVAEFIELIGPSLEAGPSKQRRIPWTDRFTDSALGVYDEARDFFNLVLDALYWTFVAPLEGRGFRWGLLIEEIHEMGVRAVKINFLMNFLLGLIIAMLSAAQLRMVGLDIFVADLLVIAFARELAALMTAIVVSARTGAAIAAELATMKVQEEIDALRGMGMSVSQFLIAPKLLALLIVMPCLVVMGMIAGTLGGSVWGMVAMGIDSEPWFRQVLGAANISDAYQGLAKCMCFAVMIVLVGCHNGLRVTGGSRGVGLMTTRSVVMDIFFIVLIDMVFAAVFYYVL